MNIRQKSRRQFIKSSLAGAATLGAMGLFSGCASLDDYLFDDKNVLDDEVVIIGGGITGLYVAQLLRAKLIEFRLYEANSSFGGRIKSADNKDFGANLLSNSDKLATQLVTDLKLTKTYIDKENYFLIEGMEEVVHRLSDKIIGLLPYRNFRLRWELIEIQKLTNEYELIFQNEQGQKKVKCKKLILTLPPSQWAGVKGLMSLPEMEFALDSFNQLKVENAIRLILPTSVMANSFKAIQTTDFDNFKVRHIIKKHRHPTPVELDVLYPSNVEFSIDYVYGEIRKKMQIKYPFSKLSNDQFYSWQQSRYIQGAYFSFPTPLVQPQGSNLILAGDSIGTLGKGRIETALQSAKKAVETLV
jgi:hypothetical protein